MEERAVARRGGTEASVDALKIPPHSIEAEQSVLGGLLLDNQAVDRVAKIAIVQGAQMRRPAVMP